MGTELIAFLFFVLGAILAGAVVDSNAKKIIDTIKGSRDYYSERDRKARQMCSEYIQTIMESDYNLYAMKRRCDEYERHTKYNGPETHPAITDWYTVVRRSGLYKTLFRDRALFDAGTKRWGGPEDDPVVYWLLNIPLPDETARFHIGD